MGPMSAEAGRQHALPYRQLAEGDVDASVSVLCC